MTAGSISVAQIVSRLDIVLMPYVDWLFYFFFFQAEDGIRDKLVTGVQTCALPISGSRSASWRGGGGEGLEEPRQTLDEGGAQIVLTSREVVVGAGHHDQLLGLGGLSQEERRGRLRVLPAVDEQRRDAGGAPEGLGDREQVVLGFEPEELRQAEF